MWRKYMVPWTKHGTPKWWPYYGYPVGYVTELYEQLTLTKVYTAYKTRTSTLNDVTCRLWGKSSEILAHVLAGCSGLAQTKYLERHNAALKVLFFEMLRQHKLILFLHGLQMQTPSHSTNDLKQILPSIYRCL